jgi:hypothetical protein
MRDEPDTGHTALAGWSLVGNARRAGTPLGGREMLFSLVTRRQTLTLCPALKVSSAAQSGRPPKVRKVPIVLKNSLAPPEASITRVQLRS